MMKDFGIARMIQKSDNSIRETVTCTGMMPGTLEYMAPEMVMRERVDSRIDVYAQYIILFQIVSGHLPFQGNAPYAVAPRYLQELLPLSTYD